MRDYATAALLSQCKDDVLVDAHEIHVLTGISKATIAQRRVFGLPAPHKDLRLLRWRLGDVRVWMQRGSQPHKLLSTGATPSEEVTPHRTQSSEVLENRTKTGSHANTPRVACSSHLKSFQ